MAANQRHRPDPRPPPAPFRVRSPSPARPRSSRSRLRCTRRSRPRTPASISRWRAPAPVTASSASAPARSTSPTPRARSAPRARRMSAPPTASSTSSSRSPSTACRSSPRRQRQPVTCLTFADLYALTGPESTGFATWAAGQALATELGSTTTFPDAPLDDHRRPARSPAPTTSSSRRSSRRSPRHARPARGSADDPPRLHGVAPTTTRSSRASQESDTLARLGRLRVRSRRTSTGSRRISVAAEPNGTCVEPTHDTISDGTYPISRALFIYVNKAKAAENPAVAAYVDYYLADGTIDNGPPDGPLRGPRADELAAVAGGLGGRQRKLAHSSLLPNRPDQLGGPARSLLPGAGGRSETIAAH